MRGKLGSWIVVALGCALTMVPIGILGAMLPAPPAPQDGPKIDPARYPGYDAVCDSGVTGRFMDGGRPVRYWGPEMRSTNCFRDGEDVFRKHLAKALYVAPDKLASLGVPPGEWIVQIQPGLYVSSIPPDAREQYLR